MATKGKHLETFSSGRVRLSIFLGSGEDGVYLYPGKPAYWYTERESGKPRWSENLKVWHLNDASICYSEAHRFSERWKKAGRDNSTGFPPEEEAATAPA